MERPQQYREKKLVLLEGKIKHFVLGMAYTLHLSKPSYVPLHGCIGNRTRKQTHPF